MSCDILEIVFSLPLGGGLHPPKTITISSSWDPSMEETGGLVNPCLQKVDWRSEVYQGCLTLRQSCQAHCAPDSFHGLASVIPTCLCDVASHCPT
jgi:hypothetical protein